MPQIGFPQKNLQDPLSNGGESSFILGATLKDDQAVREESRPKSNLTPLPDPFRVSLQQPDEPKANEDGALQVPTPITGPTGQRLVDSDRVYSPGTTGGPFDTTEKARDRAIKGGLVNNMTVLAAPKTSGFGSGYGAMSGGTPRGEESDGYGSAGSTQATFPEINRVGSRMHGNMSVISRPGATQADSSFLF